MIGTLMELYEMLFLIIALILMLSAVAAKAVTAQLIARMHHQVANVGQTHQHTLGRLKIAQTKKTLAERNSEQTQNKHAKLERKIVRLKRELDALNAEEALLEEKKNQRRID